jgi:hypothetical protein
MNALDDLPDILIERAKMLESILVERATGGFPKNQAYQELRREFIESAEMKTLLPSFVRIHRSLDAFWSFIKQKAPSYSERRQFIHSEFTPLFDHIEGLHKSPSDDIASESLRTFDAAGVHDVWMKALDRRTQDPEGAITMARTLLETVSKRILDEIGISYTDKEDLPKLYGIVSAQLNLAPNKHSEDAIKAILGGAMNVVNGIGTLRNKLSDSHGRGGKVPVKPTERHAKLAVNMAGAIATFLVETYAEKRVAKT